MMKNSDVERFEAIAVERLYRKVSRNVVSFILQFFEQANELYCDQRIDVEGISWTKDPEDFRNNSISIIYNASISDEELRERFSASLLKSLRHIAEDDLYEVLNGNSEKFQQMGYDVEIDRENHKYTMKFKK